MACLPDTTQVSSSLNIVQDLCSDKYCLKKTLDEAVELKPLGRSTAEYAPKETALGWKGKIKVYGEGKRRMEEKHEVRVGTWNVRTMNAMGKLENVKEEMRRNRLR